MCDLFFLYSICIIYILGTIFLGIGIVMVLVLSSATIFVGTILGLIVKRRHVQAFINKEPTTPVQYSSKTKNE